MKTTKSILLATMLLATMSVAAQTEVTVRGSVEREAVAKYIKEVSYNPGDDSRISRYLDNKALRQDYPEPLLLPVTTDYVDFVDLSLVYSEDASFNTFELLTIPKGTKSVELWNLKPTHKYYYYLLSPSGNHVQEGELRPEGQVRFLALPSVRNVRDLGGWTTTDGRRIRYGLLYRGGELNGQHPATEEDIELLRHIGVEAEIDMRLDGEEEGAGVSAFGFLGGDPQSVDNPPQYYFTDNSGCCALSHITLYSFRQKYRKEFEFIVNNLRNGRPTYFHCIWGADRTGMLAFLIEGLLGVPYDQLMKDYELSSLYSLREKENIEYAYEYISSLGGGSTLKDKFYYYFVNQLYVKPSDIEYFREQMLEDSGVVTAIDSPQSAPQQPDAEFDLQGRPASHGATGIRISKGKKILR